MIFALLERRTWKQTDLARAVGVSPRRLRTRMLELAEAGVPLERELEHPFVYWSVPRSWFPGGCTLKAEQLEGLSRLVARHPKTAVRERLLADLLRALPEEASSFPANADSLRVSDEVLETLEDAAAEQTVVSMHYFSANRGDLTKRDVSVHRIEYGSTHRFIATCHEDGRLKWFRADRIQGAELAATETFRSLSPAAVEQFARDSFDGYRGDGACKPFAFSIRWPEGRWAVRNLPSDAVVEPRGDEAFVTIETSGLDALARHLVGLGGLVRAETPELRSKIVQLARELLAANTRGVRKVNGKAVRAKRASG